MSDTEVTQTEPAEEATKTEGELLDSEGKVVTPEEVIANQEQKKEPEAPRPEWLDKKFKAPEDLAKAYTELEKTLKEKGKVAPDTYEFDAELGLDPEDEGLKGFSEMAKKLNMTNAQANEIVKFAKEAGYIEGVSYDEEMKKLGSEAPKLIDTLSAFASTKLTPEEQAVFSGMSYTADQVKLLHKIVRMNNSIPARPGTGMDETPDSFNKKLQELLSSKDIRSNMEKQREAEELAQKIASMK